MRDGTAMIAASTGAEPTAGLVFYDLKSCLRAVARAEPKPAAKPKPKPQAEAEGNEAATTRPKSNGRRRLLALGLAVGSLLGVGLYARRGREGRERIDLYFADGSLVSLPATRPRRPGCSSHARDALRAAR